MSPPADRKAQAPAPKSAPQKALEKLGLETMKNTTPQADQLVMTELKRWEDIVKRLDLKQD